MNLYLFKITIMSVYTNNIKDKIINNKSLTTNDIIECLQTSQIIEKNDNVKIHCLLSEYKEARDIDVLLFEDYIYSLYQRKLNIDWMILSSTPLSEDLIRCIIQGKHEHKLNWSIVIKTSKPSKKFLIKFKYEIGINNIIKAYD